MDWTWVPPVIAAGVVIPAGIAGIKLNAKFTAHEATDKVRFDNIEKTLNEIKDNAKETRDDVKTLLSRPHR